jgi:hypothetical protein
MPGGEDRDRYRYLAGVALLGHDTDLVDAQLAVLRVGIHW